MQNLLDGFNFVSPVKARTGRRGKSSGVAVKIASRGNGQKSITFTIYKDLMKRAGIVIGDRVDVGVKYDDTGIRFVFIRRSPDGAYAVSGMAQYRGSHANGNVKMAARDELMDLDGFNCDISEIQFLDSGGFIAND